MAAWHLLGQRKFLPLFLTQFLGAFNDNLFKNAVVLLVAFTAASESSAGLMANLATGLFIVPYILFSPFAGRLSDKFDKAPIIRHVKAAEIFIMGLGGLSLILESVTLMMVTIFLMGAQSAFFGPAKFSILPDHLKETEITAGNGLISMTTFLAIILGLIAATVMVTKPGMLIVSTVLAVSTVGYLCSRFIPPAPSSQPDLDLDLNLIADTKDLWRRSRSVESVYLSILAVSWLWFLGSVVLTQMPSFAKFTLAGDESLSTLLIMMFVIGIAIGSAVCIWFSRGEIELGLVPLGAFLMTVFGCDLFFVDYTYAGDAGTMQNFMANLNFDRVRVLVDLVLLGVSAALYIIPLNALIQVRSHPEERSRIIAATNIISSFFMVAAALVTMAFYAAGLSTPGIFFTVFAMNLAVAAYVFGVIPEFALRFVTWILASTIYRLTYEGRDHVPRHGPVVIVANHVSFIDWFVITAACRRPVRFIMDHTIFKTPFLGWLFRLAKAIPIAPAKEDPDCKAEAFLRVQDELRNNQVVCIFPEGNINYDGELMPFRPGVEKILEADPVPVVPIAISGLYGSFFSRSRGKAMKGVPKPTWRRIQMIVGEPMGSTTKAVDMQKWFEKTLADLPK